MPQREEIKASLIPQKEIVPIPERIAITRAVPKTETTQNRNQQTNVVSPAVAESTTPEESVKLSPQLSALARKEQAFRQRELALKQREKDLESKLVKADQFEQLTTKMSAKDFSEAEKLGLDYNEYSKYKVSQLEGEDPQAQAFKEIKDEIAAIKAKQEESISEGYEETVKEYKKEIASAVAENPEFSSIKELKLEGHVLQLILDSWEEDEEEMTVEQACKDIEDAVVEQGKKFTSISKLKNAASEERTLPPPKRSVNTLTNQMQPSGNEAKPLVSLRSLSESERYAEARRRALARRNLQGA